MPAALPLCPVAIAVRPSVREGREPGRDMSEPVNQVAALLHRLGYTVLIDEQMAAEIEPGHWRPVPLETIGRECGLVVAVGGDGTLISVARQMASYGVPLVGINQGRLGFLTDLSMANIDHALPRLLAGEYREERRALLEASSSAEPEVTHLAMNDVVVNRGGTSSLVDLEIALNDRFAYGFRADGVIVATPTGSTAYALSAAGPIMAPSINAFTIVPIAPHALTNRPIVIADDSEIRITVTRAREALASVDGHHSIDLTEGDYVTLRKARETVRLWHPLDYDYYHTLREKLGWTETPLGLAHQTPKPR